MSKKNKYLLSSLEKDCKRTIILFERTAAVAQEIKELEHQMLSFHKLSVNLSKNKRSKFVPERKVLIAAYKKDLVKYKKRIDFYMRQLKARAEKLDQENDYKNASRVIKTFFEQKNTLLVKKAYGSFRR